MSLNQEACAEVDLGLHEGRLAGDAHQLVGEVRELLVAGARHLGELVRRGLAAALVARRLGPGLADEEVDLVYYGLRCYDSDIGLPSPHQSLSQVQQLLNGMIKVQKS